MRMLSSWEKKSLSEVVNVESMESGLKYHKEKTDCQDDRINLYIYFPIFISTWKPSMILSFSDKKQNMSVSSLVGGESYFYKADIGFAKTETHC